MLLPIHSLCKINEASLIWVSWESGLRVWGAEGNSEINRYFSLQCMTSLHSKLNKNLLQYLCFSYQLKVLSKQVASFLSPNSISLKSQFNFYIPYLWKCSRQENSNFRTKTEISRQHFYTELHLAELMRYALASNYRRLVSCSGVYTNIHLYLCVCIQTLYL